MNIIALIIVIAMCLALSGKGGKKSPAVTQSFRWVTPGDSILSPKMAETHAWEGGNDTRYSVVLGEGVDEGGGVYADLSTLPNMLVGGTAGSGKSVGVRGMLVSILSKNSPNKLEVAIVDPKMVDYMWAENLPHLIGFETDIGGSASMLKGIQDEMMRRYSIMKSQKVDHWDKVDGVTPHILIVIDEFASLMDAGGKKALLPVVQDLAQKGRASGIHLILATQRPDAKVFDTRLKSNCLGRVAFRVPNFRDSMTILDDKGAENLMGNGDGLYTCGDGKLHHFQSVYTTLEDAERVASWWTSDRAKFF